MNAMSTDDKKGSDGKCGRRNVIKKTAGITSAGIVGTSLVPQQARADNYIIEDDQYREIEQDSCSLWLAPNVDHHIIGKDIVLGEGASAMSRTSLVTSLTTIMGTVSGVGPALGAFAGVFASGIIAEEMGPNDTLTVGLYDDHKTVTISTFFGSTSVTYPVVKAGVYYWPNVDGLPDSSADMDDSEWVQSVVVVDELSDYLDIIADIPYDVPDIPGHLGIHPDI